LAGSPSLTIQFQRCVDSQVCDSAYFEITGEEQIVVEVRTTEAIESILARELGKSQLTARDREAVLSVAGVELIHECLVSHGHVDSPLLLTSDFVFRRPGMERHLLHEAGLLA
jgi:hypothetical protein